MKQGLHLSYELVTGASHTVHKVFMTKTIVFNSQNKRLCNLSQSIQFAFNHILGKESSFKEDIYCLKGNKTEKLYKVM